MKQTIVIIGAGASGLVAAIQAARTGASVYILEHTKRIGKKILSTGNGKCNLTNLVLNPSCYRSDQPEFPIRVLEAFGVTETLDFFEDLGIYPRIRQGYVYPNSEQAVSVLDVLRLEAKRLLVSICCEVQVEYIRCEHGGFTIKTTLGSYEASAVILATGSKAAPLTGSDGSGYELARALGHRIIKPLPALVQLRCKESYYRKLAGIRIEAAVTLMIDEKPAAKEQGELQLTDYGISGIPVFQISRYVAKALDEGRRVSASLDFMPALSAEDTRILLEKRTKSSMEKTALDFLTGLWNAKLNQVLLNRADIPETLSVKKISKKQWSTLVQQIKAFDTQIKATNSYEQAQICCGGVDTREINPSTMESKLIRNLYLVGELLDVDGICGGYNLQFAWSSGSIAGMSAGQSIRGTEKEGRLR